MPDSNPGSGPVALAPSSRGRTGGPFSLSEPPPER